MTIEVKVCNNDTFKGNERSLTCKSKEEIVEKVNSQGIFLNFLYMNSYFDPTDYEDEIKYYVDDKLYWYLDGT